MAQIETARIVSPVSVENPLGYIVINADDFVEGMVLFEEPAPVVPAPDVVPDVVPEPPPAAPEPPPAPKKAKPKE